MNTKISIVSSESVKQEIPCTEQNKQFVLRSRQTIKDIMDDVDNRLIIVLWPCSMDFEDSLMEYARHVQDLQQEYWDKIFFIMRCYPSKPRSRTGWTWVLSHWEVWSWWNMNDGISFTRRVFQKITDLGVPIATEALYPDITENYLWDLISYSCIWSRSCSNESHWNYAASIDYPIWLKNSETGDYSKLINFLKKAKQSKWEQFVLWNYIIETQWNNYAHIILRWTDIAGVKESNFTLQTLKDINSILANDGMTSNIIIDCSHDNSVNGSWKKDEQQQIAVAHAVVRMVQTIKNAWLNNISIKWLMIESYLVDGKQSDMLPTEQIVHGKSLTDSCLWREKTEEMILDLYNVLQ